MLFLAVGGSPAVAQEQLFFPSRDNAQAQIVAKINAERVRLDIGLWLLNDGEITTAIINRHLAGIPVRVLGDRAGIFESDPNTRASFERLASAGVPIRLRYHPTFFPEIMHWKCGIFVGQNLASIGSANWTSFELTPVDAVNFKDEAVLLTNDTAMIQALKTKFDQMWVDTTYFLDWPEAYRTETGLSWTVPMSISRVRLEPDYLTTNFIWGQGPEIINPMIAEIDAENVAIDMVSYRLTVPSLTDALIRRKNAGVPVRVFIEPTQYRSNKFPEYWLVGNEADRLWAAGIPIKQRLHQGLTHMKTLITSRVALLASSNYTKNWQRDHNYFISALTKPGLYLQMKDEFNRMWNDAVNYETFKPLRPEPAALVAPGAGGINVSTLPKLEWKRAPWAVTFDVYLGTSPTGMTVAKRVSAVLNEDPPETYSFTPTQALLPSTTYWWKVVSRTFATDLNPALTATSEVWSFTTGTGIGGGASGPYAGTPLSLPGTLQAENFDTGGSGIAYGDSTSGNSGGQYRTTDVDVESTGDTGGGYNVGWVAPGEWLKYTVSVATAGIYTLEARVASSGQGGTFHIEADGVDKTGPMAIPDTGGWQSWTTITLTNVSLTAGPQVWRVVFDAVGAGGNIGNLNYLRVTTGGGSTPVGPTPFGGTPLPLPGTLQAENFDDGGSGIGYVDTTAANLGGQYRTTNVDIEGSADVGGGYNIGWIAPGEWLKYTVNVTTAGTYDLEMRVASSGSGGTFHIEVNGTNVSGTISIPNTGGWQSWTTVKKPGVALSAGVQVWKVVIDAVGGNGAVGNLNYIRVALPVSGPVAFAGTPTALPGTLQMENFDEGAAGAAFADTSLGNLGGQYRATDIDIETTSDTGGGYSLGWVFAGEWLRYSVNVSTAGIYDIDVRVASGGVGGTFHIEVNGVDKTGPIAVPNTGGWQTWRTIRAPGVTLAAGAQVWRVVMDTNGPTTAVGNFNWLAVTLRP